MPRYVILTHDFPYWHLDFMLESVEALRTWRLHAEPHPGTMLEAVALPAHRRHYLDYEGPVSGHRGSVARWDAGTFTWVSHTAEEVIVDLVGAKLQGRVVLTAESEGRWRVVIASSRSSAEQRMGN